MRTNKNTSQAPRDYLFDILTDDGEHWDTVTVSAPSIGPARKEAKKLAAQMDETFTVKFAG
jgi:hypothetical protein